MLAEFTLAIQSFDAIIKMAKGIKELKEDRDIILATDELYTNVISTKAMVLFLQSSYSEIQNIVDEQKKKIIELEDWKHTKDNYSFCEITPGVFVYIPKEFMDTTNKKLWYCANCFNNYKKISIYERSEAPSQHRSHDNYSCPNCSSKIIIPNPVYIEPIIEQENNNSDPFTCF